MLAGGETAFYLRRGATLPARATQVHATTRPLARGQSGEAVHIPLVQGESARADRNKVIGVLRIVAERIARDLPAGSEVQMTLSIDESARTRGSAYVPLLDQTFDDVVLFEMENKPAEAVGGALAAQRQRLEQLEALASGLEGSAAAPDGRVEEIASLIEEGDRDSIDLADQMVRVLSEELDQAERETSARTLLAEHEEACTDTRELLAARGSESEQRQLSALDGEFRAALGAGQLELARARLADVRELHRVVLWRFPEFWRSACKWVAGRLQTLGRIHLARHAVERSAAAGDDVQALASSFFEMMAMLPEEEKAKADPMGVHSHVR
jgi:molecular chaperone DnaK